MSNKLVDGARFHEDLASSWSSGYSSGGFARRLAVLCTALSDVVTPGANWLDAGCGTGILTRELSKLGANATGVDASPNMIRMANAESLSESDSIEFRQLPSIEAIDIPTGTFDGVLCSSVLEYVDSPKSALSEFSRLLKPEGKLLITVANKRSLVRNAQKLCKYLASFFGKGLFSYLDVSKKEFSVAEIEAFLVKAGFSVSKTDHFDPLLPQLLSKLGLGSLIIISSYRNGLD